MDYSDILMQYTIQQRKNEIERRNRHNEVIRKIPEIKEIEGNINKLLVSDVKTALKSGDIKHIADRRKQAVALKARIERTLKENGYPKDYLDNVYRCAKCKDTGFIGDTVKKRCSCMEKNIMKIALKEADLSEQSGRFEDFDEDLFSDEMTRYNKTQKKYMQALKKSLEEFSDRFPGTHMNTVLITGAAGLGKTFLLECIANRVIQRGHSAGFFTAYGMFDTFYRHRLGRDVDLDIYFNVPLLLIDDLGTEPLTNNVTVEYLFSLLNERQRTGKHTIIATNLRIEDIRERYGERVYSRVVVSGVARIYALEGSDIRKKQSK